MTREDLRTRQFVTLDEVAAYLNVSISAVYRMEKAGTLPTRRARPLNGRVQFDAQLLAAYDTAADNAARARALMRQSG